MLNKGLAIFGIIIDIISIIVSINLELNAIVSWLFSIAFCLFLAIIALEFIRSRVVKIIEARPIQVDGTAKLIHNLIPNTSMDRHYYGNELERLKMQKQQEIHDTNKKYLGWEKTLFVFAFLITFLVITIAYFPDFFEHIFVFRNTPYCRT